MDVDQAKVVRPGNGDTVLLRHGLEPPLQRHTLGVAIGIAIGVNEHGLDAALAGLFDKFGATARGYGNEHRVHQLGKRGQ